VQTSFYLSIAFNSSSHILVLHSHQTVTPKLFIFLHCSKVDMTKCCRIFSVKTTYL